MQSSKCKELDPKGLLSADDKGAQQGVPYSCDLMVADLAASYVQEVERLVGPALRDRMAIGRKAEQDWKRKLADNDDLKQSMLRLQTGVDSSSGGGDLRSQRMFDLVFRHGRLIVCLEVQIACYEGHKIPQFQAQLLYLHEVSSTATVFYKVFAESDKGPRLIRWTRFNPKRVDLTSLLKTRL